MYCSKCGKAINDNDIYCPSCGNKKITEVKSVEVNTKIEPKKIPWHQNFKWWHILIISFISLFIYFATKAVIFDYIFFVGIIFTIVQVINAKRFKKRAQ